MKKTLSILLLACLSLTLLGMTQDIARANNSEDIETQILTYTEEWFRNNFSEHYDISGYSANISNFQKNDDKVYAEIAIGAMTTLKYDSVEELPYMRGIKDTVTRRYTAHTNDRNNKIYSSVYACYVINGN